MRTVLLGLACYACVAAQGSQPKASLEGRVTNSTGKPLGLATIALVGNNRTATQPLPPAYRTTSNSDGVYAFAGVEPNTYRIFVQRSGYLDFIFRQADGKVICPIAEGEKKKIDIAMTAESFVSGRVMTEAGEPFPDARVNVVRVSRVGGRKQLTALSPVVAGPDGSFSIGRLSGAQYYLAAANPPSLTDTNQREIHSGKAGDERYVTTYYPSAIDIAGATLIDVRAEAEVRGLDIRLRRARVYHVAGKVAQAAGGAAANAMVTLIRPGITDATDPMGNASRYPVMDGVFQINGLLPGTYGLQAWAGAGRQLQGHQSVVLTDHDIDDVVVTVTPGLEIPLAVRIEGADAQESQAIGRTLGRFTLTATDGVNSNAMAVAKDDGTWIFHNIGAGTYRMGVGGPDGTYVKSVRYGEKDVTRSELDTTAGGGALVAVLSTHAGEVAGALQSADGRPMTGTTVTLWMPGLPPPGTLDQARSTMTDEAGKFRFGNLAPGEYRVAAWEKIEPGLGNVAEFHRKFDAEATVVKVKEDGREKVQAPVISAKKVEEAAAGME